MDITTDRFKAALRLTAGVPRLTFYTHDGKAHMDELLAISFAVALLRSRGASFEFIVLRVPPDRIPAVLNPGEFAIDAGGVFDGIQRHDHHQIILEPGAFPDCAFSLIVKAWAPGLLCNVMFGALVKRISLQDVKGVSSIWNGSTIKNMSQFLAMEFVATAVFVKHPEAEVKRVAEWIYNEILTDTDGANKALNWISSNTVVEEKDGILCMVTQSSAVALEPDVRKRLTAVLGAMAAEKGAHAGVYTLVTEELKNNCVVTFYRYIKGTKAGLDFNKCKGDICVVASTVHSSGHYMQANIPADRYIDEVWRLIKMAVPDGGLDG
jgi:hypothetical protein